MKTIDYKQKIKDYMNSSEVDTLYKSMLNNLFPELKESEDERIRKSLIDMLKNDEKHYLKEIAWLEKQGEHANFRNKIQIGDKVTRNENGVLVNLSQLNRVAKKNEKQGEQKPNPCDGCINRKGCINCENEEHRETEQKSAWSEEDEYCRNQLIVFCENCMQPDSSAIKCANWLKSLKDRFTWKPSEEQMKILNEVLNFAANHENPHWNDYIFGTLHNLIIQLKKLREE